MNLASLLPAGNDTEMGWDGNGAQDVLAVQPGAVTTGEKDQARVHVAALVRTEGSDDEDAEVANWVALDVPVVATAGRVIVIGQPGIVGLPTSGPTAPERRTDETDTDLTRSTESDVTEFFAAYADGSTDAVTAPGVNIPPLPEGVEFHDLAAWSVSVAKGDDRTGTARVTWSMGGATIEQTYRVELTRVSSADAQRWQVADVRGGAL